VNFRKDGEKSVAPYFASRGKLDPGPRE